MTSELLFKLRHDGRRWAACENKDFRLLHGFFGWFF
jgi:hypothetical protein